MDSYGIIKTNWGHLWSITLSLSITPLNAVTGSRRCQMRLSCGRACLPSATAWLDQHTRWNALNLCTNIWVLTCVDWLSSLNFCQSSIIIHHERASRPTYPLLGQANYGLEHDILWLSHSPSYLRKHPGGCRDTVMRLAMSSPPGPMWRIASRLSWHRQTRKSCITCFSWLLILLMSRLSKTKLFQENRPSFGRTWCFVFVVFSDKFGHPAVEAFMTFRGHQFRGQVRPRTMRKRRDVDHCMLKDRLKSWSEVDITRFRGLGTVGRTFWQSTSRWAFKSLKTRSKWIQMAPQLKVFILMFVSVRVFMNFLFSGYEILYLDHPQVTVGLDTGTGGEHSTTKRISIVAWRQHDAALQLDMAGPT